MEHFDELDDLVNQLVAFCSELKDNEKYATTIFAIVKLLLSQYSVVKAVGMLSFVADELKRENPRNPEELTKCLYI